MTTVHYWLLLVLVICDGIIAEDSDQDSTSDFGFAEQLDFSNIFNTPGKASLAASPISAAVLNVDKSQYPQLFDTVVSSSIDSLHTQIAPIKSIFSADNFGFNPIASQNFFPSVKSAQLKALPKQYTPTPNQQIQQKPLQYNIQTIHDANYRTYKPEQPAQGEEILSALRQNPSVAAYFKPTSTNVEITHPLDYRKEELIENPDYDEKNYKNNAYIPGPTRIRRYTDGRRRRQSGKKRRGDDEDDPYDYKSDYTSRPKIFDSDVYSSAYKEEKDPNKEYDYPYYDSGYDHKEYERIKELSEKQAADIKQNPGNCQEVKRDSMTCMVCKDPKTGGNYESCSYVAEPKNNKYAYSKERKFDSNDEPDEPNKKESEEESKPAKYEESQDDHPSDEPERPSSNNSDRTNNDGPGDYKAYYVRSSKPKVSAELRSSERDSSEESDPNKQYDYQKALPGFYTNNEPKKDVEHVLAEFKKKDRSSCNKVQKNGMTCFQCIDKSGLKHEECMFVSESAPKRSHLAYQELKEFTSKPPTLDGVAETAESQIVATSATPLQKSAALVISPNGYGRKLKRKKVPRDNLTPAAANTVTKTISPLEIASPLTQQKPVHSRKIKRSENSVQQDVSEAESDKSHLAPPEEFAGASKGAFWADTMPRYSRTLGVTLPEFMLERSEHESSFDETVAGV